MPYITSVEYFCVEERMQEGWHQGLQDGLAQGLREGQQQGETTLLAQQLVQRFGPLPQTIQGDISLASADELNLGTGWILAPENLEAVFDQH